MKIFTREVIKTDEKILMLEEILKSSKHIVFFTGAGASTESGIPDFRSETGLYSKKYKYPPETYLSHDFFFDHTEEFFDFYRENLMPVDALPSGAHRLPAFLESSGKDITVVTQNIDGLHTKAGSKKVFEIHGSIYRNYCTKCRKFFDEKAILNSEKIPRCDNCGGVIKPDVVLYGEPPANDVVIGAVNAISKADALIICGTSLTVYPAASFVRYFSGSDLVMINKTETYADRSSNLIIKSPAGEVSDLLIKRMQ